MRLDDLYTNIYQNLVNNEALISLLHGDRIFDYTPDEKTPAPYVVIGDFLERPGRILNDKEREVEFRLHIWTSETGRFKAVEIKNAIIDNMIKSSHEQGQQYFFESFILEHEVQNWCHGVLTLRTYIEKEIDL